nr:RIB43A-like with coiled-coils protein 2 isoform X1 [Pogona vitticeps]
MRRRNLDPNQQDLAEAAALQRRRYRDLQRQSRVFDARLRTIGIDKEALDTQIKDRKIQEATQRACDESIAAEMKQNDKVLCMLDERQKKDGQILNKAVNEFRKNYQQPDTRREFDLSDPQALKKDTPARLADNDPRCTISGLQKFMGEDLNSGNRWKFQKEQTREWLLQQHKERQNALADKKNADDLFDKQRLELDQRAMKLQIIDEETRRAICVATEEFNKALGEGEEAKGEERTAHCSGGACEGTDKKSELSAKDKMEEKEKRGEHQGVIGSDNRTEEKVTVEEKAGKWEICLAEGEWEEQEGSVWQEDKSEEGVVWFDTVVERYERRKKEERRRAFEKVRDQGLLKDFPHLRIGGLLPNPAAGEGELKRMVAQEWSVIVTLQEAELRREWEKSAASFPEGPDERGWVRHSCCGTICAMRSAPPPRSEVKERRGMFRQ